MEPIRGSPYRASFNSKSSANANNLIGPSMAKYIAGGLEDMNNFIQDTKKGSVTKDKNLQDVKILIGIKDCVEQVFNQKEEIVLKLDCLDESLRMFQDH